MVAPAPPDTNPGRPPRIEVTNPMRKAAYKPVKGLNPARMARIEGIMVMATVIRPGFGKVYFFELFELGMLMGIVRAFV